MKTNANKMAIAAIVLLLGSTAAFVAQQALPKPDATPPPGETKAPPAAATAKPLIFRSLPSWNRNPDFEDALMALGTEFEVKSPDEMESTDLSRQPFIIIPGSQGRSDFYPLYAKNAGRFEQYVTNGGTLVLELNGAENFPLALPRGVRMEKHFAKENTILLTNHPIVEPVAGKTIRANYASHGFLTGVPKDALVLAVESVDGVPDLEKPTFIEYPYGAGRVIAACQCFHDQDRSGRGILMDTVLVYAAERKWFSPKANK